VNILLVYPEFPDTFWSFRHAIKFIRKESGAPPLGLVTVAALLPQEWNKKLVDLNIQNLTRQDLEWADYVFLSAMIVQRDSTKRLVARCKKAGVPVVAGGPLFVGEYEKFPDIDHFVLNEAELTLPPFLEDLEHGCLKWVYATSEYADMHQTPLPMWELLHLDSYASMNVQFSRGCPFNCEFCNITALLGHRVRTKTPKQMVAELDSLYRLGWRGDVFFVDDNFIGNKKQIKNELLPGRLGSHRSLWESRPRARRAWLSATRFRTRGGT